MAPFPALPSLDMDFKKGETPAKKGGREGSSYEHVLFGIFDLLADMLHKSART